MYCHVSCRENVRQRGLWVTLYCLLYLVFFAILIEIGVHLFLPCSSKWHTPLFLWFPKCHSPPRSGEVFPEVSLHPSPMKSWLRALQLHGSAAVLLNPEIQSDWPGLGEWLVESSLKGLQVWWEKRQNMCHPSALSNTLESSEEVWKRL